MDHPINSRTRFVGRFSRIYRRYFRPGDPLGWADYHVVADRRGTLWIHCHGMRRRIGFDLEFTGVPADLRKEAMRLLIGIIYQIRRQGRVRPDSDFGGRFSASRQRFSQAGTFRRAPWSDKRHAGSLRIVDFGEPLQSGFPARLFAAHLVARGEATPDPLRAEALYRRATELFPGEPADLAAMADFDPPDGDITGLQACSNLGAWIGLASALRRQNRGPDACAAAAEAIARCPDWARLYRSHFLATDTGRDAYHQYWEDIDIGDTLARRTMAPGTTAPNRLPRGAGGFGIRANRVNRV